MNEHIKTLINRYNQHFECSPFNVYNVNELLPGFNEQDVPDIYIVHYSAADLGRPHDILITAGISQSDLDFKNQVPEDKKWRNEIIIYHDKVIDRDISSLAFVAALPFHDKFLIDSGGEISTAAITLIKPTALRPRQYCQQCRRIRYRAKDPALHLDHA